MTTKLDDSLIRRNALYFHRWKINASIRTDQLRLSETVKNLWGNVKHELFECMCEQTRRACDEELDPQVQYGAVECAGQLYHWEILEEPDEAIADLLYLVLLVKHSSEL